MVGQVSGQYACPGWYQLGVWGCASHVSSLKVFAKNIFSKKMPLHMSTKYFPPLPISESDPFCELYSCTLLSVFPIISPIPSQNFFQILYPKIIPYPPSIPYPPIKASNCDWFRYLILFKQLFTSANIYGGYPGM